MQDAAEFYDYFAEHMFPPIKSHLRDWFVQRFRKCAHCKAEMASGEKEVEHMIKVLIPDKVQALLKLQDMLPYDKWNEPEGFSCQKCSGQSHQVTERPLSLPNLFLVQLCRFRQGVQAKKTNLIQFPIGETEVIASAGTGKYRVDGVFYRSGIGVDTGHYYTISRDVEDSSRWVKWDDSQSDEADDNAETKVDRPDAAVPKKIVPRPSFLTPGSKSSGFARISQDKALGSEDL
ncbi:UBP12 Ubiquitin C-terminal hydrolase, partial [Pyrenophora tritici-repentis]